MASETGNSEALYGTLQKLGMARETGLLSLISSSQTLYVAFHEGKIVGIRDEGIDSAHAIAALLVNAGCVVEQVIDLAREAQVSVEQLQKILVDKEYIQAEEFERASKAYELNALYKMRESQSWQIAFSPGTVDRSRPGGIAVTPAQLLLDLAELDADEERFTENFGGLRSTEHAIFVPDVEPSGLLDDENVIWNVIGVDGCPPLDVLEMSLLSDYAIVEGLLGLLDRGAICVEAETATAHGAVADAQPAVRDRDDPLSDGFADYNSASQPERDDVIVQLAARHKRASEEQASSDEFPSEFEPDGNKWNETERSNGRPKMLFLRTLNYRMLEPAVLQRVVLAIMLGYLATVAFLAPTLFDVWFKTLSDYTGAAG